MKGVWELNFRQTNTRSQKYLLIMFLNHFHLNSTLGIPRFFRGRQILKIKDKSTEIPDSS